MKNALLIISLCAFCAVHAQSISEKKQALSGNTTLLSGALEEVQKNLQEENAHLQMLYEHAKTLMDQNASSFEFEQLVKNIALTKGRMKKLEESWINESAEKTQEESYAIFHQPQTTVGQLLQDYGSNEYVVLIPPDIATQKISMSSMLAVPKESFQELLELLLAGSGIGIRTVNPYLRELYKLQDANMPVIAVTSVRQELELYPESSRICFVFLPSSTNISEVKDFLERVGQNVQLHSIGKNLFAIGLLRDIKEMMKVFDFVDATQQQSSYKTIPLAKSNAQDVSKIIESVFGEKNSKDTSGGSLKVIALQQGGAHSLFVYGLKDDIVACEKLVAEIESSREGSAERVLHWYQVRYSNPEELASVLDETYEIMLSGALVGESVSEEKATESSLPVTTAPVGAKSKKPSQGAVKHKHFIVDEKTASLVMVVEKRFLSQLQALLAKLDIPKKMVRIDVLLFERKLDKSTEMGMNLARFGSTATGLSSRAVSWDGAVSAARTQTTGITRFFLSRPSSGNRPAFDLAYSFLLRQEEVQINANPSVTTLNKTPASIKIVEEISVDTGAVVDGDKTRTTYSRNQYGVTIELTPTVHDGLDALGASITIDADIIFDDKTGSGASNQPDFIRRNVKNQVRIVDGESAIIGGLRRKRTQDVADKTPFLGEIPFLGRFFSDTKMVDQNTEMLVLITPHVIPDDKEAQDSARRKELSKRPGDIPEFLESLQAAQDAEREKYFTQSLQALFGPKKERKKEYDGS